MIAGTGTDGAAPRLTAPARCLTARVRALAGTALCCLATAGCAAPITGPPSQVSAVRSAVARAVRSLAALGSPPAAYTSAQLTAIRQDHRVTAVPATERQRLQASGQAVIARYFTGPAARLATTTLTDTVRADAEAGIVNAPEWVSRITFTSIGVHGSTAGATADVTIWIGASAARQAATAPWQRSAAVSTVESDTMTLSRQPDGRWLVSTFAGQCVRNCP